MRIKHPQADATSTPKSRSAPEGDSDSDWDTYPDVQEGETQGKRNDGKKNVPGPSKACDTAELIAGRVIQKNNAKSGADVHEGRSNAGWRRCEEA